jgi:L-arabinose isomerase
MPYIFWRPDRRSHQLRGEWLRAGGTHHEVISLGDVADRWKMLCDLWKVNSLSINNVSFKNSARLAPAEFLFRSLF